MFVLTENGELVNLALAERVAVTRPATSDDTYRVTVMFHQNAPNTCIALCSCDNEEHGTEIVQHIADALENGVELYDIRNAKVYVYTCDVCDQRFEVPRRGGKVHYLRGKLGVVCPDCWTAGQDEAAGGAAQ